MCVCDAYIVICPLSMSGSLIIKVRKARLEETSLKLSLYTPTELRGGVIIEIQSVK